MINSVKQTKKLSNSDIVDIYTSNGNSSITTGFRNSTADYVIAKDSDLAIPYFTIQNDGTVVVEKDFVVKGNQTITNSMNINVDSSLLSIGLGYPITINSMTQLSNNKNYALVSLDTTKSKLLNGNDLETKCVYLQGVKGNNGISTIDYGHKYSAGSSNNLFSTSIIPNSNNLSNKSNMYINNNNSLYNVTSNLTNSPLNFLSSYDIRIGSGLQSSFVGTSSVTSLPVQSTKGFKLSGDLLLRNSTSFGTLFGTVPSGEYNSLYVQVNNNYNQSDYSNNTYLAAEDLNSNVFVIGKLSSSPTLATGQGANVYQFLLSKSHITSLKSNSNF